MFRKASDVIGLAIAATDGKIGSVEDLLFDDRTWSVRWAVIDTGDWLPGREVLLPPDRLLGTDLDRKLLKVDLTRAQVEASPPLTADAPVSRRYEETIYDYYGWAPYWEPGMGGMAPFAPPLYAAGAKPVPPEPVGDPDLRSAADITGYGIAASDGAIGHVADLLLDGDAWTIRYLIVDTRNWWPGKKVLIAPHWVRDISWSERTIRFDMTRDRIRSAPEWDPALALERDYEARLHAHYDMPSYWL